MDPVQKAVINHTFGVPLIKTKRPVISCNVCQIRFNSEVQEHKKISKDISTQNSSHSLSSHVAINMLYLAIYTHTPFTSYTFLMECVGGLSIPVSLPAAGIDTEDVVHLLGAVFCQLWPHWNLFKLQWRVCRNNNPCTQVPGLKNSCGSQTEKL